MPGKEIPDSAIDAIARHINEKSNKTYHIPVIGNRSLAKVAIAKNFGSKKAHDYKYQQSN